MKHQDFRKEKDIFSVWHDNSLEDLFFRLGEFDKDAYKASRQLLNGQTQTVADFICDTFRENVKILSECQRDDTILFVVKFRLDGDEIQVGVWVLTQNTMVGDETDIFTLKRS